jgi:hypothetical protein
MKETSPVSQLGNFVDRPWGVSEIGGSVAARNLTTRAGSTSARLVRSVAHRNSVILLHYSAQLAAPTPTLTHSRNVLGHLANPASCAHCP